MPVREISFATPSASARFAVRISPRDAQRQFHMIPAIDSALAAADLHGMGDGAAGEGDGQTFVCAPSVGELLPGTHHQAVNMGIITVRVVMEKDQLLHVALLRNAHPFQPGAMSPAFLFPRQLLGRVLRVVHHNVGVLGQIAEGLIVDRRAGFVVGGEDECPAVRINSYPTHPWGWFRGADRRVAPCKLTGLPSRLEKWRWAPMTPMFTGK